MSRPNVPWTCLALAALLSGVAGCSETSKTDVVASPEELYVSSEQLWATGTQFVSWQTPASVARVAVKVRGFHHGSFRVSVRDDAGVTLFDEVYWVWDDRYVVGGDAYLDLDFTRGGLPGAWTVRIDYAQFSGHLYLNLRDRQAVAADNPVAPPGTPLPVLDPSFGVAGVTSSSVDQGFGSKTAIDSQGRIVVAGSTFDGAGLRQATVWRYTAAGALDASFGTGGRYTFNASGPVGLLGLDLDASDRPVVCGWVADPQERLDLLVLRLTPNGALDTTFGAGGTATFDDGADEVGVGIDHDAGGRVLVGGTRRLLDDSEGYALVVRFTPTGARDQSFGAAGVVRTTNRTDRGRGVAVAAGGRPLLLGERNGDLILWRYAANGTPDLSFGAGGLATDNSPVTEDRVPLRLIVSPSDGSLAAVGYRRVGTVGSGPRDLVVWRFDADGAILTAFNGGVAIVDLGANADAAGLDAAFDAAGDVVVVGTIRTLNASPPDASATVWRFVPAGAPDLLLGPGGFNRFDRRGGNTVTGASGVALDAAGKVVVAGGAANVLSLAADPVVWRLSLP